MKKHYTYLIAVILLINVKNSSAQFSGGSGTKDDPYQISTPEQLDKVRNYLESDFILINDIDLNLPAYSKGKGWVPIGESKTPFSGNFNGAGYLIENLYINSSIENVGLFAFLKNAQIDSLGLTNCKIQCSFDNVGALVGNSTDSRITNCYSRGNISGRDNTGGLIGYNYHSILTNCFSIDSVFGREQTGGLVGYSRSGTITYCYARGYVEGTTNTGGLIGEIYLYEKVSNSFACGTVLGDKQAGGLVGRNDKYATIKNCCSMGNVSGKTLLGGLVGENCSHSTIESCYATGNVSGDKKSGGLVGKNDNFSAIESCYATGRVSGNTFSGGLVGENSVWAIIEYGYFNSETTRQTIGVGINYGTQSATGLTVAQMKQDSSFTGFDFELLWTITNGSSFPCLQENSNFPIILQDYQETTTIGVVYNDSVVVVPMGDTDITVTLENQPEGMSIENSVISWTPNCIGLSQFTVVATDGNNNSVKYTHEIMVVPFNGKGSKQNPFQITSIEELNFVRNLTDKNYILLNDLDFSGSAFDSKNSPEGWIPIVNFTGSFNGSGHVIKNLYINASSRSAGLFMSVIEGTIDSLGLSSCSVTGNENVGGIVGYSQYSSIRNCFVLGEISGNYSAGGLVGNCYLTDITNCYANVRIKGFVYIGGLAGQTKISNITNCYATGTVTGYADNIGGFSGYNSDSSHLTNSYSACLVTGLSSTGNFIGYADTTVVVVNCYYNSDLLMTTTNSEDENNNRLGTGLTTAQMKQQSSFTGFHFDTTWVITNGNTFPRLKSVYNYPLILPTPKKTTKIHTSYSDTMRIITMDNADVRLDLHEGPVGMVFTDSVISWTANSPDQYDYTITATDGNGSTTKYKQFVLAISFENEGSKEDPFQITNIKELNLVRYYIDKHFILMNDLDFSGSAYDSVNNSEGWVPIGIDKWFQGSFNGAGHKIFNLYINRKNEYYIGLFAVTWRAFIENLGIINCTISGKDEVGGIVGSNHSSILSNCFATGNISGERYVGGLTGLNTDSDTITNCYFVGNVSGEYAVGGLTGGNCSSFISDCYALTNISGTEKTGGFSGVNILSSVIKNSYSVGKIAKSSSFSSTGAMVGINKSSEIQNSYYNTNTSVGFMAIGINTDSVVVTGLTTAQMKQGSSFASFDFDSIWTIRNDSTYPALRSLNNAPFAFADTLTGTLSSLLKNDFDYETPQSQLLHKYESIVSLATGTDYTQDTSVISYADSLKIIYRIGEYLTGVKDTLWGNQVTSYLVPQYPNQAPVISSTALTKATEGLEYIYVVIASDEDGDALTYSLSNAPDGMTISENRITWIPVKDTETSGEIVLTVSDGELTDTETFTITVSHGTGLDEIATESISIYPNPVRSYLTIQSENTINSIQLISSLGATMYKQTTCENNILLDMNNLKPGVYFIMIETNTRTYTHKIIKVRSRL